MIYLHAKEVSKNMVSYNKLVGRERECKELQRVMNSDRSEFVIVYGRRRVGKTLTNTIRESMTLHLWVDIIFLAKDS